MEVTPELQRKLARFRRRADREDKTNQAVGPAASSVVAAAAAPLAQFRYYGAPPPAPSYPYLVADTGARDTSLEFEWAPVPPVDVDAALAEAEASAEVTVEAAADAADTAGTTGEGKQEDADSKSKECDDQGKAARAEAWRAVYSLEYGFPYSGDWVVAGETVEPRLRIKGLEPNTTYIARVRAKYTPSGTWGPYSYNSWRSATLTVDAARELAAKIQADRQTQAQAGAVASDGSSGDEGRGRNRSRTRSGASDGGVQPAGLATERRLAEEARAAAVARRKRQEAAAKSAVATTTTPTKRGDAGEEQSDNDEQEEEEE